MSAVLSTQQAGRAGRGLVRGRHDRREHPGSVQRRQHLGPVRRIGAEQRRGRRPGRASAAPSSSPNAGAGIAPRCGHRAERNGGCWPHDTADFRRPRGGRGVPRPPPGRSSAWTSPSCWAFPAAGSSVAAHAAAVLGVPARRVRGPQDRSSAAAGVRRGCDRRGRGAGVRRARAAAAGAVGGGPGTSRRGGAGRADAAGPALPRRPVGSPGGRSHGRRGRRRHRHRGHRAALRSRRCMRRHRPGSSWPRRWPRRGSLRDLEG